MSVEQFSEIFSGLEEAYGTYEIQKQQANGKQAGTGKRSTSIRGPKKLGKATVGARSGDRYYSY